MRTLSGWLVNERLRWLWKLLPLYYFIRVSKRVPFCWHFLICMTSFSVLVLCQFSSSRKARRKSDRPCPPLELKCRQLGSNHFGKVTIGGYVKGSQLMGTRSWRANQHQLEMFGVINGWVMLKMSPGTWGFQGLGRFVTALRSRNKRL